MVRTRRAMLFWIGVSLSPALAASDVFDLLDINEGELRFLTEPPKQPPHLQSTHIVLRESSLRDGWIGVKQCHYNLAPVGAMQIVFRADRVRKLEIVQTEQVGRAWVEGPSVQLTDVGTDAMICIVSETRSLRRDGSDGSYTWHGGPYMRRFLDGYFPMHVKVAVDYPSARLKLSSLEPAALKLKAVTQPGHVRIDALFEGRLDVKLRFDTIDIPAGVGWQ